MEKVTYYSLLVKYKGDIWKASRTEVEQARQSVPQGTAFGTALHRAKEKYLKEHGAKNLCINKFNDCDEEVCHCVKL